ncbi:MAG: iron ABC transporter permease [candidate division FCPU426 bacterium]
MKKTTWIWWGLALAWVGCLLGLPWIGVEAIRPQDILSGSPEAQVFWSLRVPRLLAGMLAGSTLGMAGMAMQALFRNPLAEPFTLGTASGASLGACFYLWTGWSFGFLGLSGQTWFAFAGALLSLGLVYGFSQLAGRARTETLLLAGVAGGIFFSSLILLLQYLADQVHSLRMLRWLMGSLEVVGYWELLQAAPLALLGSGLILALRFELNLLAAGEDLAVARGLDLPRVKLLLLAGVGVMVGTVVALTGPVGFVGLMVPHICRQLLGPDHRRLAWAVLLLGMSFLPACDAVARVLLAPAELPVGVITALLGGPFFLWVLTRNRP